MGMLKAEVDILTKSDHPNMCAAGVDRAEFLTLNTTLTTGGVPSRVGWSREGL
jgi:hypothetical protein